MLRILAIYFGGKVAAIVTSAESTAAAEITALTGCRLGGPVDSGCSRLCQYPTSCHLPNFQPTLSKVATRLIPNLSWRPTLASFGNVIPAIAER